MHCRNPYCNPPDFTALAAEYQPLKEFLILDTSSRHGAIIDFRNEAAQRRLTEAIMFCHFGIQLWIPENRLCPPVPNRLNYILWIQDIVHAHDYVLENPHRSVQGIDIGTGSTVIYPFLGCKLEPEWEFVATELDDISYECGSQNISTNNMESRIHLEKATRGGNIFFILEGNLKTNFEFTMCNPPFYSSPEEVVQSASGKELVPNAVCTGADTEMIFANGGEEGFVGQMVQESELFQTRCKWYTSMLGKMSSVATIVENFRKRSITNYAITEFVQGQTRRWAVGWSFTDMHLPDSIARIPSIVTAHPLYQLMPSRNTLTRSFSNCSVAMLLDILDRNLRLLEGVSTINRNPESANSGVFPSSTSRNLFVEADGNTWSRSARRSRRRRNDSSSTTTDNSRTSSSRQPALTCSAQVIDTLDQAMGTEVQILVLEFQWLYGTDRSLFESFVSHVWRKVGDDLQDKKTLATSFGK